MALALMKWLPAAAFAASLAGPALAQSAVQHGPIQIDQIQTGDLWSDMDVTVCCEAGDASSTSTAVGNTAAGLVTSGDIDFSATQQMQGDVSAQASLTGGSVTGGAYAASTAYGNAASGGTWNGNTKYRAEQVMTGDTEARTQVDMLGAGELGVTTTAIANVSTPVSEYGDNRAFQQQDALGSVNAESDVKLCCNGTSVTVATTAGGNAVSSTGSTSTVINGAVQNTAAGERIAARTLFYANSAVDTVTATTAAGNSYTLHNEWGFASLGRDGSELFQGNNAEVDAQSWVTLDDFAGSNGVSAFGVGNSALISNVGSDTNLFAIQSNFATVGSQAAFTGSSSTGGIATLSATSIGNAATTQLCNICGDAAIGGRVNQFNQGAVYARGTMTTGASGGVHGAATAIGNSATYQSGGH